jgi:aminoglycoside 6'-N-acetyltransferase I
LPPVVGQRSERRFYDVEMERLVIRPANLQDASQLAEMRHRLWPGASPAEHARELAPLLAGEFPGSLPGVILVAQQSDGQIAGFIEADLRSHADGCDPSHPAGYIEGWYVAPEVRRKRVGTQLVIAAEEWARNLGCREMASDAWLEALDSQSAHESLGYEVVDRCVHYRKSL